MGRAALAVASNVPEFYVEGLGHIEPMGVVSRHVMVTKRYVGPKFLLVPAVYIIMPNANIADGILKTTKALAIDFLGRVADPVH